MAWYHRVPAPKLPSEQRKSRMEGLWIRCDGCGEIIYKADVEKNLEVCPKCDEHFPLPVRRRLDLVLDPGTFDECDIGLESTDPLQFSDSKKYRDRIKATARGAVGLAIKYTPTPTVKNWLNEMHTTCAADTSPASLGARKRVSTSVPTSPTMRAPAPVRIVQATLRAALAALTIGL